MLTYKETIQKLAENLCDSIMAGGSGQPENLELVALIYGKKLSKVIKDFDKAFAKV